MMFTAEAQSAQRAAEIVRVAHVHKRLRVYNA